jgi:hypothetical protein
MRQLGRVSQKMGISAKRANIGRLVTATTHFGSNILKGFAYLTHLLRHPGIEFHVLDLVGGIAAYGIEDETNQPMAGTPSH